MKTCFLFFILVSSITMGIAQGARDLGTNWNLYVYDKNTHKGFPLSAVDITVTFKDTLGNILYIERHEGSLDASSHINLHLGHGVTTDILTPEIIKDFFCVSWNAKVSTPGGEIFLNGSQGISSVFFAARAINAEFADALGGYPLGDNINLLDVLDPDAEYERFVLINTQNLQEPGQGSINPFPLNQIVTVSQVNSLVTGEPVTVVNLGSGLDYALNFSQTPLTEVENQHTLCVDNLGNGFEGTAAD